MQKPIVTFVENIPINPFVFSNGLICLDILDTDWSPILTVSSVTLSIFTFCHYKPHLPLRTLLSSQTETPYPLNNNSPCFLPSNVS